MFSYKVITFHAKYRKVLQIRLDKMINCEESETEKKMKIEDNKVGKNDFHVMMNSVNINKIVYARLD